MPDTFNPNTLTFANCTERIKKALGVVQLHRNKIVTSRDPEVVNAFHALKCDGVPGTGARYSGKICEPGAAPGWVANQWHCRDVGMMLQLLGENRLTTRKQHIGIVLA